MKKTIGILTITMLIVLVMPTPSYAQYGGGGGVIPVSAPRSRSGSSRVVPPPLTVFGGRVLGVFTAVDAEKQVKIDSLRSQLIVIISRLIALLQSQLAAAIAAGGR